MSLNWKEIDAVLNELKIIGGKIQQSLQPTPKQLILEIYLTRTATTASLQDTQKRPVTQKIQDNPKVNLFISLEQGEVRMHRCTQKIKKTKIAQRFQQLLQARIIGYIISDVVHVNRDRIIKITLNKRLYNDDEYSSNSSTHIPDIHIPDISTPDTHTQKTQVLHLYIRLWNNHANIILTNAQNKIIDLAFRKPTQNLMPGNVFEIPEARAQAHETSVRVWHDTDFQDFNAFIEHYYIEKKRMVTSEMREKSLLTAAEKQLRLFSKSLEKVDEQLKKYLDYESLEYYGNLILANISKIEPGQKNFEVTEIIDEKENNIIIPLQTDKNTIENATHYFNQAKKAKRSIDILKDQKATLENQIAEIEKLRTQLTQHDATLSATQQALLTSTRKKARPSDDKSNTNIVNTRFTNGPYIIVVGRNAKENDIILRRFAKGNDMWLHIRGYSGSYVFIRTPKNKTIPLDLLHNCGQLAALYSKAKNETHADIYYTEVKYLKKVKNALGLVVPIRNKNLQIKIDNNIAKLYLKKHTLKS